MTEDEQQQDAIHNALAAVLPLDDGEVLTGWVVLHETQRVDGLAYCGRPCVLGSLLWATRDDDVACIRTSGMGTL